MRRLLLFLCAVHFVRFWILPARDGLWIDETGTYWTIAGGWDELWARTAIHPNSRLYGALLMPWTHWAGTSEIALRLPSLVAMLTAIAVLASFLRRELGAGAALPMAALCLASPELSFYAIDARPYAMAVLLIATSVTALIRLWKELSWRWAAAWILSAGLLVHLHPVVSTVLAGQVLWIFWRMDWRALTARRALAWCGLLAAAALVALPEALRLMPIVLGFNGSALPGRATAAAVSRMTFPKSIFGPALLAAGALVVFRRWRVVRLEGVARDLAFLGAALVFATSLLCTAYSASGGNTLLLTRYMIGIYPGSFLLLCVLLARWTDERGRLWFANIFSASTLVASLFLQGWIPVHTDADWRGAMATLRQWEQDRAAPLLIQSGFVEASYSRYLTDPKWQEFLYAPALYYPHPGPTYVLPYRYNPLHTDYRESLHQRVSGQRFAAVVYSAPGREPREIRMLAARHGPPRLIGRVRRLGVYVFGPP